MACVLGLLFLSWAAAISDCLGADLDFTEVDAEEDLPDMNYVKAQAEAGRPRSQTQLADFYIALSDFTNALPWYQKAAEQNYIPAQLSLAGCLLSGRGTEKDPAAASQWLRRNGGIHQSTREGAEASLVRAEALASLRRDGLHRESLQLPDHRLQQRAR